MQPLLDGPCLLVEIQGVLSLLPWYAWHVGGFPCENVPTGEEERGERELLCRDEVGPDKGSIVGVVVAEDDRLRLAVGVQQGSGRRVIDGDLKLFFREVLCRLGN